MVKEKKKEESIEDGADLRNKVTIDQETGEIESERPLSAYTRNDDALNPTLNRLGQGIGTHEADVNKQTDLELGALADPGGIDPAADSEFMEIMKPNIEKNK
ncbi:MAG: hypothetical protein ACM3X9_04960 [Bacillota bacterium]